MKRSFLSALALLVLAVAISSCASRTQFQLTRNPCSLIPESKGINLCAIYKSDGNLDSDGRTECIILYLRSASDSGRKPPLYLNYPAPYRKGERVFYALQPDFSLKEIPLAHDVARTLPADMVFSSEESAAIYRKDIIPKLFKFSPAAP